MIMLHVDIMYQIKLHVNMIMLDVDIMFLTCWGRIILPYGIEVILFHSF